MKIPPPPFPVHPTGGTGSSDDNGAADTASRGTADGGGSGSAYDGYYGSQSTRGQNSADYHPAGTAAPPGQSRHRPAQQQQRQYPVQEQLGNAYYEHYRTSQTILYDPHPPQSPPLTSQYDKTAPQAPRAVAGIGEERPNSYHDRSYHNQSTEEAPYEGPYHHEEPYHEEEDFYNYSTDAGAVGTAPSKTTPSIGERLLPEIFALAQKLLPAVINRLDHHHEGQKRSSQLRDIDYDDDFAGACSPLGSAAAATPIRTPSVAAAASSERSILFAAFSPIKSTDHPSTSANDGGSPLWSSPDGNFKTTGLEESDYYHANSGINRSSRLNQSSDGGGGGEASLADDPEMGEVQEEDPMQYLPRSAALLVSALQSSSKSSGGISSSQHPPALVDEAAAKSDARELFASAEEFFNTPPVEKMKNKILSSNSLQMDMKEREADMLLESIRKDGDSRRRSEYDGSQDDDGDAFAASMAACNVALARHPSNASFDDDEGSMVGDMARLSQSIMNLQHDLENVDFSQLEGMYDDGGLGGMGGGNGGLDLYDNGGLLARLKLWFSRGMIVEQKLLNTYVNPTENDDEDGSGVEAATTMRYADNPVLTWSLALMWSFVVLILMHPKIAELVEGGDPGRLADIIEWMFG